ncbi:MAG: cytochrome c family protein [Pseudomonadota bacterium]|nr:cytochrome c family protein [Pseudomonadota bacterium]
MMDSFEFNKIAGAVLFTVLIGFGVSELAHGLVHVENPETVAYPVPEIAAASTDGGAAAEEAAPVSLPALLAMGSADKGANVFKKCAACHSIEDGGPNKVGPNLHAILGRDIASHEGFAYSATLAEMEGDWTFDSLRHFLHDPKGFASGTKMAFAGVKKDSDLASLLLFLHENGSASVPLPTE